MAQHVLLVEDSIDAFQLIKRALGSSIHLEWAKTLADGLTFLRKKEFDLILLDIMLPDGDGYRFCSIIKTEESLKTIPVIFLTARTQISDKVLGFSVGADDFITKPFEPLELRARIESRLRKSERERQAGDVIRIGDIEIDKNTQRVNVFEDGHLREVDLTPIEFKLLLLLSKEANKVHSRNDVLNSVWGDSVHVFLRSVDTHISKLRKKLGHRVSGYIESVHGTGYRFVVIENPKAPTPSGLRQEVIGVRSSL